MPLRNSRSRHQIASPTDYIKPGWENLQPGFSVALYTESLIVSPSVDMAGTSITKIAKPNSRQREILEVVLKHGWDYMRLLLSSNEAEEPELPPQRFCNEFLSISGPSM